MQAFIDTQQCPAHLDEQGVSDGKGWYYRQEQTGKVFRSFTWDSLLKSIHAHRMGMISNITMDLESGWMERVEDEMCRRGGHERDCHERGKPGPWVSELERLGRKLWNELHAHALAYPPSPAEVDITSEKRWLLAWEQRIPSFTCNCRGGYDLITRTIQPVFTGRKEYYLWSVLVHNEVNRKLGKPEWNPSPETLALLES